MADMCDTCGDGVVELLRKILSSDRDIFIRLGQLVASGGGGAAGAVNLTAINGVAPSVGCGVSDTGTLRVAQATDCVVTTSNNNGAGAAAVNIQDGGNSITVDGTFFQATQPVSGTVTANQGTAAATAGAWPTLTTDGVDIALVTAAGEQNVLSTAQPGVDIGDVTVNNGAGAAAVNIQDGGNSITVDSTSLSSIDTKINSLSVQPTTGSAGIVVRNIPLERRTYSAAVTPFTPAASPDDIFTITGSASTTVRVTRIVFSAVATAPTNRRVRLVKRSTADTGGTSAVVTAVPHDSASAAATATVLSYTANPTSGTFVGNLRARIVGIPMINPPSEATMSVVPEYTLGNLTDEPIVLRGTGEVLAINLQGLTLTGGAVNCYVEWTEE